MKIFKIFPHTGNDYAYIEHTGLNSEQVNSIIFGKRIIKIDSKAISVKNKTKKIPDFIGTGLSEFFVNEKLKQLFEEKISNKKINFLKVTILNKPYWLINILGLDEYMDNNKSEYSTLKKGGEPDVITNLVVDENKVEKYDIFRIKESPLDVFVTSALKEEIEQLETTGIEFISTKNLTIG